MLRRTLPRISHLTHTNIYGVLDHNKMEQLKAKIYGDQEKSFKLKAKFFLK